MDAAQLEAKINELNERLRQLPQVEKAEEPPTGGESSKGANEASHGGSEPNSNVTAPHQAAEVKKKSDKRKQRHKSKA